MLYMRKYCDCKNPDIDILMDLHVLSPSEYERVVFGMPRFCTYVLCVCVCMYGCCIHQWVTH
jgi:hypothetical protein